jgi:hypothetical protein
VERGPTTTSPRCCAASYSSASRRSATDNQTLALDKSAMANRPARVQAGQRWGVAGSRELCRDRPVRGCPSFRMRPCPVEHCLPDQAQAGPGLDGAVDTRPDRRAMIGPIHTLRRFRPVPSYGLSSCSVLGNGPEGRRLIYPISMPVPCSR